MNTEETFTIPEAIKTEATKTLDKFNMNYQVLGLPSYVNNTYIVDGKEFVVPIKSDYFGLLNTKTMNVINQVKKGYYISQNREVLEAVLMGMKDFKDLNVVSFDDIHGGRKIFIQIEVKGKALLPRPDGTYDEVTKIITVLDSKDGSSKLSIGIGDRTRSCSNEFFKFYKEGEAKFMHSASLEKRMEEIPNLIEFALLESMRMTELYKEFASTPITRALAMDAMATTILGYNAKSDDIKPRALNNMNKLYDEMEDQMNDKGDNLWGLHSGVTKWTTHSKAAPKRDNGRLEGLVSGTNYKVNQTSLKFVTMLLDEMKKEAQLETA